jgi:hypothetical protein
LDAGGTFWLNTINRADMQVPWLKIRVTEEDIPEIRLVPSGIGNEPAPWGDVYEDVSGRRSTLWVHGLDPFGSDQTIKPWGADGYWTGEGVTPSGPNPVVVNYHARAYVWIANAAIRYEMYRHCTGTQECIIACHSAGCAHTGYALTLFDDGRFNVLRVIAGGAASGGSELASIDGGLITGDLGANLGVSAMRGLYDHDALNVVVDCLAGAAGGIQSVALPGEDDGAVAYHSAGGAREALSYCNSETLTCYELPIGFVAGVHFVNHRVEYRDDDILYDHDGIKWKIWERLESYAASL